MKRKTHLKLIVKVTIISTMMLFTFSCTDTVGEVYTNDVPQEVIASLEAAGFVTDGLREFRDGYLVETDIYLTRDQVEALVPNEDGYPTTEQYRTNNLVNGFRTIRVFMDPDFGNFMQNAFDDALARYNALNLRLTFVRTLNQNNSDIAIEAFFQSTNNPPLGFSAGFPTGGNPATNIGLNTFFYNNATARPDAATAIAHEIGHAIGFRHTDFMNRAFSCNQVLPGNNEGDAGVGANHIPNTPVGPEAGSWMLACSNNTNRPFTNADEIALVDTYGGLVINGNTFICSGNNTYTLTQVPQGSTVTWQVSPVGLLNQSSGNGTTAVLSPASSLASAGATLTFSVLVNGVTFNSSTEIWVGKPSVGPDTQFSNGPYGNTGYFCSSHYGNTYSFPDAFEISSHQYRLKTLSGTVLYTSPIRTGTSGNANYTPPAGWYLFEARATNTCGTSQWIGMEVEYVDCSINGGGGGEEGEF